MGGRRLGRRELLKGAGVAAGGVALTGVVARPAVADDDDDDGRLTGSWLATRHDDPPGDPAPVQVVLSLAGGGVAVTHDINPAGPPFTGTWAARRGGREFVATIWSGFVGGPGGAAGPTIRVRIRGSHDDDRISGTYEFAVFDPVTGAQIEAGTGSFSGSRIDA